MAYIGKTPVLGNFVKLDAITVVNGQAAYTMQNGGVNFTSYDNVNQFLVSLNGILQSPTDSFTVSGSTLTFASNLSTGDVIDFVMVLGNTLDVGTPSDNTVSLAKLTATGTKDSTTFLRGDNTFAEAGGGKVLQVVQGTDSTERTTTSTSFVSATLNVSITPSSTSNKILIMVSCTGYNTNGDRNIYTIDRSGTDLSGGNGFLTSQFGYVAAQAEAGQVSFNYLDSPSTTSSTTYTLHHKLKSSGTGTASINWQSTVGTIIAMEIST